MKSLSIRMRWQTVVFELLALAFFCSAECAAAGADGGVGGWIWYGG